VRRGTSPLPLNEIPTPTEKESWRKIIKEKEKEIPSPRGLLRCLALLPHPFLGCPFFPKSYTDLASEK
jgi:hypothetical protein